MSANKFNIEDKFGKNASYFRYIKQIYSIILNFIFQLFIGLYLNILYLLAFKINFCYYKFVLAVKIIVPILLVLYLIMMSIMIIFERDKPRNIILWNIVFLFLNFLGGIFYIFVRVIIHKKKLSLLVKQKEDEIYKNLISINTTNKNINSEDELFNFNHLAYNSILTKNNNVELIFDRTKFNNNLIKELSTAVNSIYLELADINKVDFQPIKKVLVDMAIKGVQVKFIYESPINFSIKRELKKAGVRVVRFSKLNSFGKIYTNIRNTIVIDGRVAFLANLNINNKQLKSASDCSNVFVKLKGDIVEEIDISTRQDIVFATNKYIPYYQNNREHFVDDSQIQYVTNQINQDIELSIIKAFCMAKKSITLQLEEFNPSESIISLLRFAINSNIDVRLMIPLKTERHSSYYASRAYAKELALFGANVYLYDGYINFNSIIIDDKYAIYGNFRIDSEHLNTALQNMIILNDEKIISQFAKVFNEAVDNSYRINNAKYLLLREKFFKNFV